MEVVYYAARANLRRLLSQYPSWTRQQYAQAVGMSLGWVKKWSKRLREAPPEDEAVLQGQSRARKHPSDPKPCCTICRAMPSWRPVGSGCHVPAAPSIASCVRLDVSVGPCHTWESRWSVRRP